MKPKYICLPPGKKSIDVIKRDRKVSSPSLTREFDFVYKKEKGMHIYDLDGRKYLDFTSSIAVMNAGHSNPAILREIKKQLSRGTHAGFSDFYAELPVKFIEYLLSLLPKKFNKVFLSNSGTESVEAAFKLARYKTGKKWSLAFEGAFHGRTMGSLSLTQSNKVQKKGFEPFLQVKHAKFAYCYRCPWNKKPETCSMECSADLKKKVNENKGKLAALFFEPIQGEGGYVVPPIEFLQEAQELCIKNGMLFCADEVQSGCFRTGKFLASETMKISPDIVSMSKAIGGGLPLGATIASEKIMDWPKGAHANTFGGNLIACAAGHAALEFIKKNNLQENAEKTGKIMLNELEKLKDKYELIGDVRGKGLMIGVELVKDKKSKKHALNERHEVLCKAKEKGLLLLPAGKSSIRFCPPLIISKEEALKGTDIFEDALKEVSR